MSILDSIIIGIITGAFSAGTTYGVLRSELKFMRRDIDEVRHYLWPDRRMLDNSKK
jgi:hypothetical protein